MSYHPNAYAFTLKHTEYTDFFTAIDDGRAHRYYDGHPLNAMLGGQFIDNAERILMEMKLYNQPKKLWEPLAHLVTHFISREFYMSTSLLMERTLEWATWLQEHYEGRYNLLEVTQFSRLMASEIFYIAHQFRQGMDSEQLNTIKNTHMVHFTTAWNDPIRRTEMLDLHEKNMLLPRLLESSLPDIKTSSLFDLT